MNGVVSDKFSVSPMHLLFVMYVSLVSSGTMSFQHDIAFSAGHDAWISVIIATLYIALLVWMMFFILNRQKQEQAYLVSINNRYFGKTLGTAVNLILILYLVIGSFVAFRNYLQIIHVWVFPHSTTWPIGLFILLIVYYAISGGFQSVTGLCLWGTISIFIFIIPQLITVATRLHLDNILPVFNHPIAEIATSSKQMTHEFTRCEILLIAYPFIREQKKAKRWAYWAVLVCGLLYLLLSMYAIVYFSQGQLEQISWPTLSLFSTLDYPLMQRMETLLITIWIVKILAIISLGLWAACHSMKLTTKTKQRTSLKIFMGVIVILLYFTKNEEQAQMVTNLYSSVGEYVLFLYIPLLFAISLFMKKRLKEE
ncbi:spore germination protein [Paenibacillus glycanilyticus]|uniref:GerAB/ArcD/ProY family transporter n=1 Tax=Paenibacillus glycanilyticus TaxID=126569 RepID=UPI002040FC70|nr:GerAB/ArcD/ProY family transporter [Paenibacillus glycanilyticus]MCM3626539.1 spore germination protein [Paenibacillus glycanilyticus]